MMAIPLSVRQPREGISMRKHGNFRFGAALGLAGALLAVLAVFSTIAIARSQAAPQSASAPTIEGNTTVGQTLTATNGNWSNSPTSFTYQWQRCNASGASCHNIAGADAKT